MAAPGTPDSANQQYAYPSTPTGENGDVQRDNSPELLRWRADILMDEMMLGAVDVTAGGAPTAQAVDTLPAPPEQTEPAAGGNAPTSPRVESGHPPSGYPPPDYQSSPVGSAGSTDSTSQTADDEWWRKPFAAEPQSAGDDRPYSAFANLNLPTWSSILAADEEQPVTAPPAAYAATTPPQPQPENNKAVDGMLRQPSVMRTGSDDADPPEDAKRAPWREHDEFAGFETSAQRAKRTNLLPRMSVVDATVLLREIDEMRAEIGSVVPESHEWSVRSRHLLGKAETILRHEPDRSAEVEYYLNQVRSILDRVRQTYRWSQAYYRQLRIYLSLWLAFAAVVLAGALLYRQPLAEFYTLLFGATASSFAAQMFGFWLAAPAAGALGGALGALLNMQRYKHADHGFLDRKYSLRGLLLPIMAAIVSLIIFAPFALIIYFVAPSGMMLWVLALLPLMLAFAYGFYQESLYGTQA